MKRRPQVALLIESSNSYARGLLRGIHDYVREHSPWSMYLPEQGRGDAPPTWLKKWHGDGIIARIENNRIARAVVRTGVPIIDVSAARLVPELPWIETDDAEIARLAAQHFLDRGFKQFGYCGDDRFNWSKWRCEHYASMVSKAGYACSIYQKPAGRKRIQTPWESEERELAKWLQRVPKPVGIMACYDIRGWQLLEVCRRVGLVVPDEVAIIGVDNDELLCNLSDPPLSSIAPDTHRTGYEAARLLARWMQGKAPQAEAHLIEPLRVVTRQSSDVLAVEDRMVSQVVQFIRNHACEGIKIADVLRAIPVSRRVLEQRFKTLLGRTPHEEILQVQFQRVVQLLTETSLSLETIAHRTGFKHVEYFSVAFKQHFGMPPSRYRKLRNERVGKKR